MCFASKRRLAYFFVCLRVAADALSAFSMKLLLCSSVIVLSGGSSASAIGAVLVINLITPEEMTNPSRQIRSPGVLKGRMKGLTIYVIK